MKLIRVGGAPSATANSDWPPGTVWTNVFAIGEPPQKLVVVTAARRPGND